MPDQRRQAVIILGMHRSGTSALAGIAARLGLALPQTPLPAAVDNPGGFYESVAVVNVNFSMFKLIGCTWDACLACEPDRLYEGLSPQDRQFVAYTLQSEFPGPGSFVFKDPRLCLTLPIWLPALRESGLDIRVLIVSRHPAEVTRSLLARNQLPESDTAPHWLHHMLEAERLTRGMGRAIVAYDALMRDWRAAVAAAGRVAGIAWPRPIALAGDEVDAFLAPEARHYRAEHIPAAIGPAPVADMIDAAWIAFQHLAEHPEAAVGLACLDQVRARFADWRRWNGPLAS